MDEFEEGWDDWGRYCIDHFCGGDLSEICTVADRTFSTSAPRQFQSGPGDIWLISKQDELYVDVEVVHVADFAAEHFYPYFTYDVTFGSREAGGRLRIHGDRYVMQADAMEKAMATGLVVAKEVAAEAQHLRTVGDYLKARYGAFTDSDD